MATFDEFSKLIKKRTELDGWLHDIKNEEYADLIKNEIDEVVIGIKNSDSENIKEELSDILAMWATLAIQTGTRFEDIFEYSINKINRRSPFIKEGKKVSKDEALRLWFEAKDKEKRTKTK